MPYTPQGQCFRMTDVLGAVAARSRNRPRLTRVKMSDKDLHSGVPTCESERASPMLRVTMLRSGLRNFLRQAVTCRAAFNFEFTYSPMYVPKLNNSNNRGCISIPVNRFGNCEKVAQGRME